MLAAIRPSARIDSPARLTALVTRVPTPLTRFAGWFALGILAFGVELAVLAALNQGLHLPMWLASALAAEFVVLGRFLTTDRLVFRYARPNLDRCVKFHAAAVGSFTVSWLVLNGSVQLLEVHFAIAAFLGSVAAFIWSALSNFLWVWAARLPSASFGNCVGSSSSGLPVVGDLLHP